MCDSTCSTSETSFLTFSFKSVFLDCAGYFCWVYDIIAICGGDLLDKGKPKRNYLLIWSIGLNWYDFLLLFGFFMLAVVAIWRLYACAVATTTTQQKNLFLVSKFFRREQKKSPYNRKIHVRIQLFCKRLMLV